MEQKVIEELTIGGEPVFLEHAEVPLDAVKLYEDNPRIRYR